jgi:hypothetical protein
MSSAGRVSLINTLWIVLFHHLIYMALLETKVMQTKTLMGKLCTLSSVMKTHHVNYVSI